MQHQLDAHADRRDCPRCGREIRAAATLCGFCWTKLQPVAPGSAGTRVGPPSVRAAAAPVDEASRMDCPRCGRRIMAAATTCGFCWVKLVPPIAEARAVVVDALKGREAKHGAV